MRRLLLPLALCVCLLLQAQSVPDSPELSRARAEVDRTRNLVQQGGLPRNRLDAALEGLHEAEDQAILRRTLYGSLKLEDLNEILNREMTSAAQRLFERQQARLNQSRKLVEEGVLPRLALTPLLEELDVRRKTLDLVESRVRFWGQMVEMAKAEQARQAQLEAGQLAASEEDPAFGVMSSARERQLEREFNFQFAKSLPVSARGDTVFHRSMGLDHTGRVDVGINPESAEGRWLKSWLERTGIPYLAFRTAVPGAATAPHIHIGPPSLRLRISD